MLLALRYDMSLMAMVNVCLWTLVRGAHSYYGNAYFGEGAGDFSISQFMTVRLCAVQFSYLLGRERRPY